ncbi:HNH endonuclease [Bradyrhizobium canariense]|uniref:HNH endonuclease n=1 Tax=Bradyrhizobium canariense TaxID=255045 RepID=UPI00117748C9|nr:HNH endonuclease [Bradyrhizobium canariense]
MIALTAPSSAEDDAYLNKICAEPAWANYLGLWASCYQAYRVHGGNPWSIVGSKFPAAMGTVQQRLYENRKSVTRFKNLRSQQVASCPMCGSSVTGALDHFLPKETFPEFSVMAANLVPACTSCNSSVKGSTYKGESPEEWLIHPYFDTLANSDLWEIRIIQPYPAARFEAIPSSHHAPSVQKRIAFHLKYVLGEQFQRACTNAWATLPQHMRNMGPTAGLISVADIHAELIKLVSYHYITTGRNAWLAAFHRGLLGDLPAQAFVAAQATTLTKLVL